MKIYYTVEIIEDGDKDVMVYRIVNNEIVTVMNLALIESTIVKDVIADRLPKEFQGAELVRL